MNLKQFFLFTVFMGIAICAQAGLNPITETRLDLYDKARQRLVPITLYKEIHNVKSHKQLPVVIINHGYGVKNTEYSFIAKHLASKGYLVVSIQHDLDTDHALKQTGNLFTTRKPLWQRGVENILFVESELKGIEHNVDISKVVLIGHSNGGDIIMLFATLYPKLVSKAISLDSRRMPFPTKAGLPILSLRSYDTEADPGVLPQTGAKIIKVADARHIDLCDRGPSKVKNQIIGQLDTFLAINPNK